MSACALVDLRSQEDLAQFEFLGKLIGLSLRTGDTLPLDLDRLTWKCLVQEPANLDDLEAVDEVRVGYIRKCRGRPRMCAVWAF